MRSCHCYEGFCYEGFDLGFFPVAAEGLATGRWRSSLERLRYQNAFDFQLYKIEEVVFYVSIKIKDLRIPKVYDFDTKSL